MQKHLASSFFVIFFLAIHTSMVFAEGDWNDITIALNATKTATEMTEGRLEALKKLDARLAQPRSDCMEPCIAYYQAAVDRILDTLEQNKIVSGVRIYQLYSSSIIVQTPTTIFAFDLDQGPNRQLGRTPQEEKIRFCMTATQVQRIALLIKYSFHTHEHNDHIDYQLTKALLDKGQTVVVTKENKAMWQGQPWAEKLTTLEQTFENPIKMGPLKVHVLRDCQWNDSLHTKGTPCNAFVVTTANDVTVMVKGDINCGLQLYGWLSLLKQRGLEVDVIAGSPIFWRGIDIAPEWNALFSPLWLPGHAWEFTHRKENQSKGHCMSYYDAWQGTRQASGSEKIQVLSWGEWIDISK